MSISKDAKPLVIKWKYKTIHQKDNGTNSIDGYINYISEQVNDRRNCTGPFMMNTDQYYIGNDTNMLITKDIFEVEKYADYLNYRKGSHTLFSDIHTDIDQCLQELKEHEGTIWIPIIAIKEQDALKYKLDSEEKWMNKARELAEVYRKELNIPKENYEWLAAFHIKPENDQNKEADAGSMPHLHFILFELEPDPHKRPAIRHKRLDTIKDKTASILSREFMKESYKERNDLENSIKSKSKDLGDMSDYIHKLIYDIYSLTHGKGKLSVGEFEHASEVLIDLYDKSLSNDTLNNSELFYKKTLNLNSREDVTRALYLYSSILDRLDKIVDKILAKEDTKVLVDRFIELSSNMRSAKGYERSSNLAYEDLNSIKREIKNSILKLSKDLNYSNRFISKKFKGMLLERLEIGSVRQDLSTYEVMNTTKVVTSLLKEAGIEKDKAKEYLDKLFDTYNDEKRKKMAMLEFNRIYKKIEVGMDINTIDFWDAMKNIGMPYEFPSLYDPIVNDHVLSDSLLLEPITRLSISALDNKISVLDVNDTETLLDKSLSSLLYIPKTKEEYEEKYALLLSAYDSYDRNINNERNDIYEEVEL